MQIDSVFSIPRTHKVLTPQQLAFGLWLDESDHHVVRLMFKDHQEAVYAVHTFGPTEPQLQEAADAAMKRWQEYFGEVVV